jgi:hypothetical protein
MILSFVTPYYASYFLVPSRLMHELSCLVSSRTMHEIVFCLVVLCMTLLLTSGPFGDSMSAARPKRWGVSRQAKDREFNPTRVELITLLT